MTKKIALFIVALSAIMGYSQTNPKLYVNTFYKLSSSSSMGPILHIDWAIKNELKQNPDSKNPIKLWIANWEDRYMFQNLLQDTVCDSAQMEQIFFKMESQLETSFGSSFELYKNYFRWQNTLPFDLKKRLEFIGDNRISFDYGGDGQFDEGLDFFVRFFDQVKEKGFQTQIQYDALMAYKISNDKQSNSHSSSPTTYFGVLKVLSDSIDVIYSEINQQLNWKQQKEFGILKSALVSFANEGEYLEKADFRTTDMLLFPKYLDSITLTSSVYMINADNIFHLDSAVLSLNEISKKIRDSFDYELNYIGFVEMQNQLNNNISTYPYIFKYLGMDKKVERRMFIDSMQMRKFKLHTDTSDKNCLNGYQYFQKLNIPVQETSYGNFFKQHKFSGELFIDVLNKTKSTEEPSVDSISYAEPETNLNKREHYRIKVSAGATTQFIKQQEINAFLSQNNFGTLNSIHSACLELQYGKTNSVVFGQSLALGQTSNFKSYYTYYTTKFPVFNRNWFGWEAGILLGNQSFILTLPGNFATGDITKSNSLLQYRRSSFVGGVNTRFNLNVMPSKLGFSIFVEGGGILDCNTDRRWQLNGQKVNAIIGNFNGSNFYVKAGLSIGIFKKTKHYDYGDE